MIHQPLLSRLWIAKHADDRSPIIISLTLYLLVLRMNVMQTKRFSFMIDPPNARGQPMYIEFPGYFCESQNHTPQCAISITLRTLDFGHFARGHARFA